MAQPAQSAKPKDKPLPLLKSVGITRAGEWWCVYELETRGDVVVSRKVVRDGLDKQTALARLKMEADFTEWWTPGAK